MTAAAGPEPGLPPRLVLYDGDCGLCQRGVRFLAWADRHGRLRFAPLQGTTAAPILARHAAALAGIDSVVLVTDAGTPGEALRVRSDAGLEALRLAGGIWRLAGVLRFVPRAWRDAGYDWIARHRFRWFGRTAGCPLPSPEARARFLS